MNKPRLLIKPALYTKELQIFLVKEVAREQETSYKDNEQT